MTASFEHDSPELAEAYDRTSDLQFGEGRRLVERLGSLEGARILDVGCGTGRLAWWMAERVGPTGRVVGVDPLRHRVCVAQARGTAARFEVGRAEDLGAFPDGAFDVACLASVLHWVDERPRALRELGRVLRPGGRLVVATPPRELSAASTVARVLHPQLRRPPWAQHLDGAAARRGCTTTEVVELALEGGLEVVDLHVSQTRDVHESGAAWVAFAEASAFGTLLSGVPPELRAPLRAEVVAAFDAQRGPDGVVVRGWSVHLVAAKR